MDDKTWFYISTAVIFLGLLSPVFMYVWDLQVANALDQYYSGNPAFEHYFLDADDASDAEYMVDAEFAIFLPLIGIGLLLLIINVLLLKFKTRFAKFSLLYAVPYFLVSAPTILLILT